MKVSMKGVYAVRAMVDMASQSQNYPVTLANIAVRQEISQHYLEQLFMKLRRAKLVRSVRGPGGGYLLAKPPEKISVWNILTAVEETLVPAENAEETYGKQHTANRAVRGLFVGLSRTIQDYLRGVSLANLNEESNRLSRENVVSSGVAFHI